MMWAAGFLMGLAVGWGCAIWLLWLPRTGHESAGAHRVPLGEEQFRTLVQGGVVVDRGPDGRTAEIALQDIGIDRMYAAVDRAVDAAYGWRDGEHAC